MLTTPAFEEIANFIAEISPAEVIAFRPSSEAQQRVEDLLEKERTDNISQSEKAELDHYLLLEHLMRLVKARARKHLAA